MNARFKKAPMSRTAHRLRNKLQTRSLVLVGLMGAGKSTIGRRVATMLELPFRDADHEIEAVSNMSIADLFAKYGEPEFRNLERRVILRLLNEGPMVLATGGGAFMNDETRKAIEDNAVSVWLKAELDILMERVSRRQTRPLLQTANPRAVMEKLMQTRHPIYEQANLTVHSRDIKRDVIARDVIKSVDRYFTAIEPARSLAETSHSKEKAHD